MDYCEEMSTKVTKGLEFVSGSCPDGGKLIPTTIKTMGLLKISEKSITTMLCMNVL